MIYLHCFLQPAIDGSLGPIGHVAAPVASILERTDRIQQSLSIGNLVFCFSHFIVFKNFCLLIDDFCLYIHLQCCCCALFGSLIDLTHLQPAMEGSTIADVKPRISDNADRIKCWKFSDIAEANQLKTPRLPDPLAASKVYAWYMGGILTFIEIIFVFLGRHSL